MSGYIIGNDAPSLCPTRPRDEYIRLMRRGHTDSWFATIDDDVPLRCKVCNSLSGSDFLRMVKARMPIRVIGNTSSILVYFNTGKPVTRTVIPGEGRFNTGGIHELEFRLAHFDEVQRREFESLLTGGQVVLASVD